MSTDFNSLIKYNEPILSRKQITQIILAQKIKLKISWQKIAEALDCSREWIIAASLGQMKLTKIDAEKLSNLLSFIFIFFNNFLQVKLFIIKKFY